jgi:amino acid permease
MATTLMRWLAFGAMITLACVRLANGIRADPAPPVASFSGVPNLFGVCVYSFMCHHSLPSLVTPITKKKGIHWLIASDFLGLIL